MKIQLRKPFDGDYPVSFGFGEVPTISDVVERYAIWGLVGHNGIDFALPEGTPILAAASGTVSRLLTTGDFGNAIMIDHDSFQTLYAHLQEISVAVGQKVQVGEKVGLSGESGFTIGPHLHFGLLPKNANSENGFLGYVDPSLYLRKVPKGTKEPKVPEVKKDSRKEQAKESRNVTDFQPPVEKESMQDTVKNSRYEALLRGRQASSQKRRETIENVYDYIKTNGPVSSRVIRTELKLSKTSVVRFTHLLRTAGKIRTIGEKTQVQYEAVQTQFSSPDTSLLSSISKWFNSK